MDSNIVFSEKNWVLVISVFKMGKLSNIAKMTYPRSHRLVNMMKGSPVKRYLS